MSKKLRTRRHRVVLNRSAGGDAGITFLLTILGAFMFLPMLYVIMQSLKPLDELWMFPPRFYVKSPTLRNFRDLFTLMNISWVPFSRYIFNTVFTSVTGTVGNLFFSSSAISPRYYGSVYVLLFNRDLAAQLDLPDLYEQVTDGTWTLDSMMECARAALADTNGDRTRDSLLAQDIYYQLTEQGRKVFFARITLEDVAGAQYEPYIFAALNSAKIMLAFGTDYEYFNAVWVKNEWSRYLSLIRGGEKKMLIPAYKDMDPYDLPEEFSHLQAQDMSKLGFMQDLIRGIKKIAQADAKRGSANAKKARSCRRYRRGRPCLSNLRAQ